MEDTQELPTTLERIDALQMHNLQLQVEKAERDFNELKGMMQQFEQFLSKKYTIDPSKDAVNLADGSITRRQR